MEVCSRGSCVIGRDSPVSTLAERALRATESYNILYDRTSAPALIPSDGGAEEHQSSEPSDNEMQLTNIYFIYDVHD